MFHPRFKGNHYKIGLKSGKLSKKKNIDFNKFIDLNKFQKGFVENSQSILSVVFPEVCDEIRGVTEFRNDLVFGVRYFKWQDLQSGR